MKNVFFFLLIISNITFGQITPNHSLDKLNLPSWKEIAGKENIPLLQKQYFLPDNRVEKLYKQPTVDPEIQSLLKSRFSHTNSNGAVYIISPDNMPCFVPDISGLENMTKKLMTGDSDNMPVVGPKIKIIKDRKSKYE